MAAKLQVKALQAMMRVNVVDTDGRVVHIQHGFGYEGKEVVPILEPATRIVSLDRGQELPDDLAEGELERLKADDAVGTPEEVAAVGTRLLEGQAAEQTAAAAEAAAEPPTVNLDDLPNLAVADLAAAIGGAKPPSVKALLTAVGDDKTLAAKVLEAEQTGLKGDGRVTLVQGLEKVIGAE